MPNNNYSTLFKFSIVILFVDDTFNAKYVKFVQLINLNYVQLTNLDHVSYNTTIPLAKGFNSLTMWPQLPKLNGTKMQLN